MRRTAPKDAKRAGAPDAKKKPQFVPYAQRNQSLKSFPCPLCSTPDALRIQMKLIKGKGDAEIVCAECKKAGRLGAANILYPFKLSYIPKLEKKCDVYFKFRDFVKESGAMGAAANDSNAGTKTGGDNVQGGETMSRSTAVSDVLARILNGGNAGENGDVDPDPFEEEEEGDLEESDEEGDDDENEELDALLQPSGDQ